MIPRLIYFISQCILSFPFKMKKWPEMWSRRMWCKPGGWSNWLNGSILIVIKPLVLTHPLFSKMQGKNLSWTDIQGRKFFMKTCNKGVTNRVMGCRGEPFSVLWFRFEHPLQFLKLTQSAGDLGLILVYSKLTLTLLFILFIYISWRPDMLYLG